MLGTEVTLRACLLNAEQTKERMSGQAERMVSSVIPRAVTELRFEPAFLWLQIH